MKLRLLLGDQLNVNHPWFSTVSHDVLYVIMELRQETDYVVHHIQKVVAFFGAMRHFAEHLTEKGHEVLYLRLDDPKNSLSLTQNLEKIISSHNINSFEYQAPDEYRLDDQLKSFCDQLSISSATVDTFHFLTTRDTLGDFYKGKKQLIMEYFYRQMRRKYSLLMEGENPEGGQWNFDKNNRNRWKGDPPIPPHYSPKVKQEELIQIKALLDQEGVKTFGYFEASHFAYPLDRAEALRQLDYFCTHLLPHFGDYQDAFHTDEVYLFHARISFALNVKMISPLEVVTTAIEHYRKEKERISLSQVEGFVRQIIGWREYIRGIYWKEMPNYEKLNVLENRFPLPDFYWTAKTKMNCMHHSIKNSLENAYAHHIQRLMIIGNFSLLAQLHPDAVDQWYLGVYADAIQWVQLPNTRGMSQWADGGIVATKPYVSAAAYISKMGNYCSGCSYDKSKRIGADACPFNSLYWNFLDDKKTHFKTNNRMAMMLRLLEKIPAQELVAIKKRAYEIIEHPDAF
jgi:deoxyribodipyrimidine photolyase-related protein